MSDQFELFADSKETEKIDTKIPLKSSNRHRILYFDLETQKSANDVGGWDYIHKMGMTVGVIWDSLDQEFFTYEEKDAVPLVDKLRTADLAVGFNIIGFDYTVLQPYSNFDLLEINTFDMLVDIHKRLHFRLSLKHLAQNTLGEDKADGAESGLYALELYKNGEIDKLIKYCQKDVEITRDLFLFGETNDYVNYQSRSGNTLQLKVDWKTANLILKIFP